MLVLSRKNQESVVVGGSDGFHRLFKVKVLEIRGANVKLGFEVDRRCSRPSFGGLGTNPSWGRSPSDHLKPCGLSLCIQSVAF